MLFDYFLKYINKNDLHGMWIKFRELIFRIMKQKYFSNYLYFNTQ